MFNNILLIDPHTDQRSIFQTAVDSIDGRLMLLQADSVNSARTILKHVVPDIIFLDVNMDGSSAFELLEEIKTSKIGKTLPIYIYSADIDESMLKEIMRMGASGFLKKSPQSDLPSSIVDILNVEPLLSTQRTIPVSN